jgi:hypothetical protein
VLVDLLLQLALLCIMFPGPAQISSAQCESNFVLNMRTHAAPSNFDQRAFHRPPCCFAVWLDEQSFARFVFINSVDDTLTYHLAACYWRNLFIVLSLLQP